MSSRPRGPYRPGQYQAPQTPAHPSKPEHAKRDTYDWATFWVAVVGVCIVAVSAIIQAWAAILSQQQVQATRDQLTLMATQQRPWVSAEVIGPGSTTFVYGISAISYRLSLRNTGQAVARGIEIESEIVPRDRDYSGIPDLVRKMCQRDDYGLGGDTAISLFPGAEDTIENARNIPGGSLITVKGRRYISATVVGCVSYRYYADNVTRHTPFAFDILELAPPNILDDPRNLTQLRTVPLRHGVPLKFERSLFGNGNPD